MTNRTQDKVTHPWEVPGFKFSIGWPVGFESSVAEQTARDGLALLAAQTAKKNRATGKGWGKGSLAPLSNASNPSIIATKAKVYAEKKSREIALARGKTTYNTGRPCARGHIADRRKNGTCVECERERKTAISQMLRENRAAAE